jgi:hypothetical protein
MIAGLSLLLLTVVGLVFRESIFSGTPQTTPASKPISLAILPFITPGDPTRLARSKSG